MNGTRSTDALDCTEAAALLHAIADPARLTVIRRLAESPACVCDLQKQVPIALNLLSYHLKVLRAAGLVTSSRRGRWIDYALTPDALEQLHAALPAHRSGRDSPPSVPRHRRVHDRGTGCDP
ncbi:metalloregulator ArsR/SmtB family transcription factor [Streptomyces sp. CC219B]|uniref:ArsR/SmtB family transcription factor n=1 Tax=Streptomyces sp. CC219B TaxID=3044574 RepID=UPI0024A7C9D7|nr:metalloregulator ArsR/SmtB family transcription factor [Streptomyces sp. CC219B]